MPVEKGSPGTAFEISLECHRPVLVFERRHRPNLPRGELGGVGNPAGVVFRQPLFQIVRPARVDLLRRRQRLQKINVVKVSHVVFPVGRALLRAPSATAGSLRFFFPGDQTLSQAI